MEPIKPIKVGERPRTFGAQKGSGCLGPNLRRMMCRAVKKKSEPRKKNHLIKQQKKVWWGALVNRSLWGKKKRLACRDGASRSKEVDLGRSGRITERVEEWGNGRTAEDSKGKRETLNLQTQRRPQPEQKDTGKVS